MKDVATRSLARTGRTLGGTLGIALVMGASTGPAWAQAPSPATPPPAATSRPPAAAAAAAVEPGVDTSAPTFAVAPPSAAPQAAPAGAAAAASGARPSSAPATPAAAGARRGGRAMDRVDLEASQITGNRELPRVLYIVPWRAPSAGDIEGRPVNSLLFELTKPVDRDVFRRENRYFDALQATAAAAGAAGGEPPPQPAVPAAGGGPEK
jgi:hypothetical protein